MTRSHIAFFSGDITRSGGTENVSIMVANELVKDSSYKVFFHQFVRGAATTVFPD